MAPVGEKRIDVDAQPPAFAGRAAIVADAPEPTDVPNLDLLLGGGLLRGSLVIAIGPPGSGKTTLANQMAFAAARRGRTALVLTALSEPTSKLLEHLRSYAFFDPDLVGESIQFLSLQQFLDRGLEATGAEIIAAARQNRAGFVVLDGFRGVRGAEVDPQMARQFLYDVGTTLSLQGATTLITSEANSHDPAFYPEMTTADVIIGLQHDLVGVRQYRGVEIIKARGGAPLPGLHTLVLDDAGVRIFPRLEARVSAPVPSRRTSQESQTAQGSQAAAEGLPPLPAGADAELTRPAPQGRSGEPQSFSGGVADPDEGRVAFGLPELDALLHGGLTEHTSTLLGGTLGVGKTMLALHFALEGLRKGEKALYLGFRETAEQLVRRADAFDLGPDLRAGLAPGGDLTLVRWEPVELNPDVIADRLLLLLERTGARRLVIDSVLELVRAVGETAHRERVHNYLAALLAALRQRGVTTLFVTETSAATAPDLDLTAQSISILAENVLLLQQVRYRRQLRRIVSVLKMRFSDYDVTSREFLIAPPDGVKVLTLQESGDAVLARIAQQQGDLSADTMRDLTPERR